MKTPRSVLHKFVNYILDYAPIVATVLVATLASLSATRSNITIDEMLQWILIVLALLSTTQLLDRFRIMKSLDSKVEELLERSQGKSGAQILFTERIINLEKRYIEAKSISINGITLATTSDNFWGTFKQRINENAQIRFIVIDPEKAGLIDIGANRFHKHQDPNRLRREIEHAFDNFESLMLRIRLELTFKCVYFPMFPRMGFDY